MFLRKRVLKIGRKFTGEHPCQSAIAIKLQCNFIVIALWYGCSHVNLLHIFRTPFPRNTSGLLLLLILILHMQCYVRLWDERKPNILLVWPSINFLNLSFLRIWSHLLKKSLSFFCAVTFEFVKRNILMNSYITTSYFSYALVNWTFKRCKLRHPTKLIS